MSYDQPNVFVTEFFDEVTVLSQQMDSVIRGTMREKTLNAKAGMFDRIGATSMVRRTSRHANTPMVDTPLSRRKVSMDDFDWADLIDNVDELRTNHNMRQEFAMQAAMALNRQYDDTGIAALNANSVAVASDDSTSNVAMLAANIIANGGTNLTGAKVRQANRLMNAATVMQMDRYMLYSPEGMEKLLTDTTVISSDFNTNQALVTGGFPKDQTWMGFKWRMTTRLPKTGNIRSMFAYQKMGMGIATGNVVNSSRIGERADKNYSTQVYQCLVVGAVRIEEVSVVQIDIDETA